MPFNWVIEILLKAAGVCQSMDFRDRVDLQAWQRMQDAAAMALGVPTVAMFRDYAGPKWLPLGAAHRHLMAPCPCGDVKNPPCVAKSEALCLAQITPPQVLSLMR